MSDISTIINRLKKNKKSKAPILKAEKTNCFRLYEKDIPEYPFLIDIYADKAVIYEKGKKIDQDDKELLAKQRDHQNQIVEATCEVMELPKKNVYLKIREKQKGKNQYNREKWNNEFFEVQENGMKFYINLERYLDTGLFLDHRPLRKWVKNSSKDKNVLNLFSYTGSISIAAATGGAKVTTVDMSKTYLEWAVKNFELNKISPDLHEFIQADIVQYLEGEIEGKYDLIILDPPSFSNSKRMDGVFDVQRDHESMVLTLMEHLNPGGTLYFSNNFRKFKLSESIIEKYSVKDVTLKSIPRDFRDQKIHVCFEITF